MKRNLKNSLLTLALVAGLSPVCTQAQIIISEVDPTGSSTTSYAADWFELENTGSSAVDITGWMMDDNSDLFADSVALTGVTSIAAGQSVVFIENTASDGSSLLSPEDTATLNANFETAWFGTTSVPGLTIGNYGGSKVGLSSSSDAVNIFDSSGNQITGVDFGKSTAGFTFDNTAGVTDDGTISTLSAVDVNGAFTSADGAEVGSPGNIAPVPEPSAFALAGCGFAMLACFFRFKSRQA
jgi:Lamin Tail Domain